MSNKMWEALLDHAKTCALGGKLYVYYPEDTRNVGVIFYDIYELCGLITGEQLFSADSLSDNQKVYVDSLVKKAYDNWDQVVEYDGKSLVNAEQNNNSVESENDLHDSIDFGTGLDHQLQIPAIPTSVPSELQMNSGMAIGGYNNMLTRYPPQSTIGSSSSRSQFDDSSYLSNDQLISNAHLAQPLEMIMALLGRLLVLLNHPRQGFMLAALLFSHLP